MVVKYWHRIENNGTTGPYICDKEEISQIIKYGTDIMWLKVQLPNGETWIYADYLKGWKKLSKRHPAQESAFD